MRLRTPQGELDLKLPLPGLYNVYNAVAAAATALTLGLPLATIGTALEGFGGAFGRVETIPVDGRGHLTSPMTYWDGHNPSYYRGVYVQGAQALASFGPIDRVDCALRVYVARNAYRVARTRDLLDAFSAVFGDTTALAAFGVTSSP